ncbi:glycosyltransferase [Nocardia sp. NPDC059240]|uniref:glycosyltransferase n=1 Tax=Nocardia sp. NPDC059240 TaxID=3346786 RepID=UPI0036B5E252
MILSVIVPARNEAAALASTLRSLLAAAAFAEPARIEILVVDSASTDGTADLARSFGVRVLESPLPGAGRARNLGARHARSDLLVFVDADTHVPLDAFTRVLTHHANGFDGGFSRLAALDGGLRAHLWWLFWDHIRLLPLPRAKAMSAFMFCTREAFETFGPFAESVQLSEEWPILAGLYRTRPTHFHHDRHLTARTSSRRMHLQPFGYTRTFAKYVWAVLQPSGRTHYPDTFRTPALTAVPSAPVDGTGTASFDSASIVRARTSDASVTAAAVTPIPVSCPGISTVLPARLPGAFSRWLARAVSAAPMHTLRVDDRALQVEKWRRPSFLVLIPLWNLWLAGFGEPIRVLSGRAWHARERVLHRNRNGNDTVRSVGRRLLVPLLPGAPADELLRDFAVDPVAALTAATMALRKLHAAAETHGDAILGNVLLEPVLPIDQGVLLGSAFHDVPAARWIDFETRHAAALLPPERRADDLWTLARSAAHTLGPDYVHVIATATAAGCLDEVTRRCLALEAASPTRSTTVLALARVPLTGPPLDALRHAVLGHLDAALMTRRDSA